MRVALRALSTTRPAPGRVVHVVREQSMQAGTTRTLSEPMRASTMRDSASGPFRVFYLAPGWVVLGAAGSLLVAIAGARLGGGSVMWWFHPKILSGGDVNKVVFYAAMVALAGAWIGLGRVASSRFCKPSQLAVVGIVWCVPLAAGAPLFSRDAYSYLAQGTIAHLGLNPYRAAPIVLGALGHMHVLHAVDPFWRTATAPYGPLFLAAISVIVGLTGSNLVLGVLLLRAFDLVGLVLLAIFVPRLARGGRADPTRAVWLAVISPLVLLGLVAPAHNDMLMAGLMVAGVALALERRPLLGIAVCVLAATIKLPALAAVIFVAVIWIRAETAWSARLVKAAKAAAAAVGPAALVTVVTGFGVGWISTALFSTPARVRLAITPATDISWTVTSLLHDASLAANFRGIESVLRAVAFGVSVIVGLALLRNARGQTVARYLGLTLVAFALGGPAMWPWYFSWGLVLLAAWAPTQASRVTVVAVLIASFLVKPNGVFMLPLGSSPFVAAAWLLLAVVAWSVWRRRARRRQASELTDGLGAARSALAEP
jgi:alpha-1,6-mannosyltransferase